MSFPTPAGVPAWFALVVHPRHEAAAEANLGRRGLETFVPWRNVPRRWSDRVKQVRENLFPGYVFCRFGYEHRLQVLNLPSVHSIVGFGDTPAVIPAEELDSVRSALRSGLPVGPWPYIKVGQRVRIEEGALEGLEGTLVRERGAWRVVVNVNLLQRSIAVEIDRDLLRAVA